MTPLLSFTALKLLNVPEVTDCVRVDQDVHVKLFYKGSPLRQWFHHGRDCRLTRKSIIQNFPTYIKLEGEGRSQRDSRKKEHRSILFDIHFFYVTILYKHTDY